MIYYRETQPYIADRVSVESRLNAGLLGLTVTRESNSEDFTVHMLTGKLPVKSGICRGRKLMLLE